MFVENVVWLLNPSDTLFSGMLNKVCSFSYISSLIFMYSMVLLLNISVSHNVH